MATTSGVAVHKKYIALRSDGMPASASSWETVPVETPAEVRTESGVTGDGMSIGAGSTVCMCQGCFHIACHKLSRWRAQRALDGSGDLIARYQDKLGCEWEDGPLQDPNA